MRRVLVTGGTKDDVAPIAVFILNVKETNSHLFDEIVVYHDGIKKKDQELMNSIYKTRFITYKYKPDSKNDVVISYFSRMVFCKYECFKLLSEYDEVVWSDYDVVIQERLDEFCILTDDQINVLTCDSILKTMFYKDIINQAILKYDLEIAGVNTPLFALSNKLCNYNEIYDWCYEKTSLWLEDLYLPEQCIVSLAAQEFCLKLNEFSLEEYACYPTNAKGNEKIIHAAGQIKFWNGLYNPVWENNYKKWINLGGTKFNKRRKAMKRKWIVLFSRLAGIRHKEHG